MNLVTKTSKTPASFVRHIPFTALVVATLLVLVMSVGLAHEINVRDLTISDLRTEVANFKRARAGTCGQLRTRFQGAVVEARHSRPAAETDFLLISDAFREALVFAESCVDLPPDTRTAARAFMAGEPTLPILTAGVVALDDALVAAEKAGWPLR